MRKELLFTAVWATCLVLAWAESKVQAAAAPQPAGVLQPTIAFDLGGGVKLDLVLIRPGKFKMGSNNNNEEKPVHEVTLSQPYYLGKYDVTQEQYKTLMGKSPSIFKGEKNPVDCVSWNDAQDFCKKLSAISGATVRLPTEAEWEYACRAGSTTTYCFGDSENGLAEYGWYSDNSGGTTHPVGAKKPNAWGLYDVHGNIWRWCSDWFDANYYAKSPKLDPPGPTSGDTRVVRGGSWHHGVWSARSACRFHSTPDTRKTLFGFRVVVAAPKTP